jgi:enoyl-CoA hydratase
MNTPVSYDVADGVATLTMDDGKANAISLAMLAALNDALDRAEAEGAVVVLAGRPGRFCAGFDLTTLAAGGADAKALTHGGFALAARLLTFPSPVVAACTGHAVALGAVLLAASDYRIGAAGPYKLVMNETAIGITMPALTFTLLGQRLHPSALQRATVLAEVFTPDNAVSDGWLDRVVEPEEVLSAAQEHARSLTALNRAAHHANKITARQSTLDGVAAYLASDAALTLPSP